jgi:hypothetical protein
VRHAYSRARGVPDRRRSSFGNAASSRSAASVAWSIKLRTSCTPSALPLWHSEAPARADASAAQPAAASAALKTIRVREL